MIRMTKLTDYGIVLLTHMAMEAPGSLHTAQDLATKSRVPVPTASKLLKALARARLVNSHRGRNGGYGLSSRLFRPQWCSCDNRGCRVLPNQAQWGMDHHPRGCNRLW